MTLPDVNVWLALALSGHPNHHLARRWLDGQHHAESVFFCRATEQSFLRLLTTPPVFKPFGIPPLSNQAAWDLFRQYCADDRIALAREPHGVSTSWKRWALTDNASPKLWMDAWLAAVAHSAGFQLVTFDEAFTQFDGLKVRILGSPL